MEKERLGEERQRRGWALWAISAEMSRSTEMVAEFIINKTKAPGNCKRIWLRVPFRRAWMRGAKIQAPPLTVNSTNGPPMGVSASSVNEAE
jgi:hypothetical protein